MAAPAEVATVGTRKSPGGVTVKRVRLLTLPACVSRAMSPLVAPAGTIALSEVADTGVMAAPMPLNCTPLTSARLGPTTVTTVPTGPTAGANELTVGRRTTTRSVALVAEPSTVVTVTRPLTAVAGSVTCSPFAVPPGRSVTATPPTRTVGLPVAAIRLVPVIVTGVPRKTGLGSIATIPGVTVNEPTPTLPIAQWIVTTPLVAPGGTEAVSPAGSTDVIAALAPLKSTSVTRLRLLPAIVTSEPTGPAVGSNDVAAGPGRTMTSDSLIAEPSDVVTMTCPVTARSGAATRSCQWSQLRTLANFSPILTVGLSGHTHP